MAGSKQSPKKSLAESAHILRLGIVACAIIFFAGPADTDEVLRSFEVLGDAIPHSLTGAQGNPERGRVIVVDRHVGLCLLCHSGPFPEQKFQGTIAPDLTGVGSRASEGQLRLRIVDASRINPQTIMPAYYRVTDLYRVAPAFRGKPLLDAEQIEDVVAYLASLRD
jgi:sulfur-oxidizing protein SoxX